MGELIVLRRPDQTENVLITVRHGNIPGRGEYVSCELRGFDLPEGGRDEIALVIEDIFGVQYAESGYFPHALRTFRTPNARWHLLEEPIVMAFCSFILEHSNAERIFVDGARYMPDVVVRNHVGIR